MGNQSSQLAQSQEDYDTWLVTPKKKSKGPGSSADPPTSDATYRSSMPRKQKKQDKQARSEDRTVESTPAEGVDMEQDAQQVATQEGQSSQIIDPAVDPRLQQHQSTTAGDGGESTHFQQSASNLTASDDVGSSIPPENPQQGLAERLEAVRAEIAGEPLPTPESSEPIQGGPKKGKGRPRKTGKFQAYVPAGDLVNGQQISGEQEMAIQQLNGGDTFLQSAYEPAEQSSKPKKRKRRQSDPDDESSGKRQRGDDIAAFTDQNLPNAGPFEKVEEERIDQFVQTFREQTYHKYGLTQARLNDLIQDRTRARDQVSQDFWKQAYEILPNRNSKAMQRHLRRKYHNFESRGKWTAEEDEILEQAYQEFPNKWKAIGDKIGRMPEDCRDRWRNYISCGSNRKMAVWTELEEMNLSEAVGECIRNVRDDARREAAKERKAFREDRDWEALVNFNEVSKKMAHTRSRLQCLTHWKKIKTRAAREEAGEEPDGRRKGPAKENWRTGSAAENYHIMLPGDKYQILHAIMDSDTFSEERIPWRLISQRTVDTPWTTADRKAAWERMKHLVPQQETLKDTVQALIEYFDREHGDQLGDHFEGPRPKRKKGRKKGGKNRKTLDRAAEMDPMADEADAAAMQAEMGGAAPVAQMVSTKSAARKGKGKKAAAGYQKSAEKVTESEDQPEDAQRPEVDPALEGMGPAQADMAEPVTDPVMNLQTYNETHDANGNPIQPAAGDHDMNDDDDDGLVERVEDEHLLPANRAVEYAMEESSHPRGRRKAPGNARRGRGARGGRAGARVVQNRGLAAPAESPHDEEADAQVKTENDDGLEGDVSVPVANMGRGARMSGPREVYEAEEAG